MSREIKFRAWNKTLNKMYFQLKDSPCFGLFEGDRAVSIEDVFFYESQDFELMQYTGLKDMEGYYIYEGDILKVNILKEAVWVKFWQGEFITMNVFKGKPTARSEYGSIDLHNLIGNVVGNIYANPELLEVKS